MNIFGQKKILVNQNNKNFMKTILILIALTVTTHAQRPVPLGSGGPDGVCYFNGTSWQCYPQAVPEPKSPFVLLTTAGMALLYRRNRKG